MDKLRVGVWKFASCDGCQLSLLDCEDELLAIADSVHIAHFLEATSRIEGGPYDIGFVEGSVTTEHDAQRIQDIRAETKVLVTIGACATTGGIQALRNYADHGEWMREVYAHPEYIQALDTSSPIADHVKVDLEVHGCPVNKNQLIELITATIAARKPNIPNMAQCVECKRAGTTCVMVSKGIPCLGPVTRAGCGNLCPSMGRGCYGCFGPLKGGNTEALMAEFAALGVAEADSQHLFRGFTAAAPEFERAGGLK
ncbi:MAG: oxidoreductase [Paracoccaceae bacterium]|nr:oxidoreductase [Paracoccaceae bacterium]